MRTRDHLWIIGSTILGIALFVRPALAREDGACKEDAKKLCGQVKPGEGRIKECLKFHQSELSPACKENIVEAKEKFKEKMEEVKQACKQDLQQYCANVTPGEGREMACLRAYSDKLSSGCKDKMPKPGRHNGMHPHHDKDGDHDTAPPPPVK